MIENKSLAYLNIEKEDIGTRLDKILSKKFNSLNFIKIQKLIRIGFFKVNNRKVKANYKIRVSSACEARAERAGALATLRCSIVTLFVTL